MVTGKENLSKNRKGNNKNEKGRKMEEPHIK